jgi:ketosteroid isomerase-like protein
MSRENVDLVMRALRAATARPKADFATVNALFHPDHILVPLATTVGGEEVKGGRGYQSFLREQGQSGFGDSSSEAPVAWETDFETAVDVGANKVLAVGQTRFRGSASGVEFEQRTWAVATVGDGKVLRTELFNDPAEALEAAGPND